MIFGPEDLPAYPMSENKLTDVIIVGAGPAGVSCALALQQLGYTAVVIESAPQCGGRLRDIGDQSTGVGDAESPTSAALALNVLAAGQSLDLRSGNAAVEALADDRWVALALEDGSILGARYLVLACGVTPRSGGLAPLPGRVIGPTAVDLDPGMSERSVAILGGGDSAFQTYQAFRSAGAHQVTIFARHLRARAQLARTVPEADIVVGDYEVNPHQNEINAQPYDVVRVCYGYEVRRSSLLGLPLATTQDGLVQTDHCFETSLPRVFAIGDMAGKTRPSCTGAFAHGLVAAREIQRRLDWPAMEALNQRLLARNRPAQTL